MLNLTNFNGSTLIGNNIVISAENSRITQKTEAPTPTSEKHVALELLKKKVESLQAQLDCIRQEMEQLEVRRF